MRNLPVLYVKDDTLIDGMRLAKPSEIGAVVELLNAGALRVLVGDINIVANNPALQGVKPSTAPPSRLYVAPGFLLGKDATIMIDGERYEDRTGLRFKSVHISIEVDKPINVRIEGTPKL